MFKKYFEEHSVLCQCLYKDNEFLESLSAAVELIKNCLKNGGKILIAGNGGSAADAQHFAAEMVCKFKHQRKGYACISLTTDTSIITAWSNDKDFNSVFARQIEALGGKKDVFIGITTSGRSQNILLALSESNKKDIKTICLLGSGGGILKDKADISIIVPSNNTPRVQEIHILLLHIIAEELEIQLD